MNTRYRRDRSAAASEGLERAYIRLLGIPEVGLRLRARHFGQALRHLAFVPTRVLDAGSGLGAYSVLLARRYPTATVLGCELDGELVSFSKVLGRELGISNLEFVQGDVTELDKLGEPFDLIVCIDVLEHVVDYKAALEGFYQMLRPDGVLYLHVPQTNQQRILSRFRDWQHDGHVREGFSPRTLTTELDGLGFQIVQARQTFGLFGKLSWELNHLALGRSLIIAGLAFPATYALGMLDTIVDNVRGLGISIVAQRGSG